MTLALITLLLTAASARAGTRSDIRHHQRAITHARTVLRFFEHHPRLLYSPTPTVRRRAWHAVAVARQTIIQGEAIIRRLQAAAAPLPPREAIRQVFGPYADQAIRVVACETGRTFSTTAQNGQYLGLFQMGSRERATYGHGPTALEQARAAYRYFVASGRDWSPWECKP